MANRTTAQIIYSNRRQNIITMLDEIKSGLDDHHNKFTAGGETGWDYVGDLGHYEELLAQVADSLMKRGEYAD